MPEQFNENSDNLTRKSKVEVPTSALDAQEQADRQMEAKLDLLEDAVLALDHTNPEFNVEDFYLGMCELVYGDEFPVNKIEKVVDAIDSYPFSKEGAKKFNDLVSAGDHVYLAQLLERNLEGLYLAESTYLPKNDLDSIRATVTNLGELSVEIRGKGPTYMGRAMLYGVGEPAPLSVSVFYGNPSTSSNSAKTLPPVQKQMDSASSQEGFDDSTLDAINQGEPVNPFGEVSEEERARVDELVVQSDAEDEEKAQMMAEIEEEWAMEHEKTGISGEDFMAERGMDPFGRPLDR